VKTYLGDEVLGFSYEGYTWYQNRHVYMSSNSNDGISTIVLYMDAIQIEDMVGLAILIMLNVLLVSSFFYPKATKFCCTSIEEPKASRLTNPYTVFLYGYSLFICVLSIVARISASRGNWPAFSLVFNGIWTKGVNEFSLWSALFFTTQATTLLFFLKTMYGRLTESLNLPSKTFLRLCESLVTYIFVFAIIIVDLSWLGIDTTALIASAGIVSIAVGMGAKDLIADILAGMFIIFESSVHMGDIVEIGGWRGTVTDIGVRTCEITDSKNNVKVINNSKIGDLVNYSRKSTSCTLEFDLPRDNIPVTDVAEVVNGYIDDIVKEVPEVTNSLRFRGIISITDRYYRVKLGWLCDESKRENLTFRLNNAVRLILERARREREEGRDRKITGMGYSE
jgi:small conductance mechanosensitive channel